MKQSESLALAIELAHKNAEDEKRAKTSSLDLLFAVIQDTSVRKMLVELGADYGHLSEITIETIAKIKGKGQSFKGNSRKGTVKFREALETASDAAAILNQSEVNSISVLYVMANSPNFTASRILKASGFTPNGAIEWIHRYEGTQNIVETGGGGQYFQSTMHSVPHQTAAPIRVEIINGILAQVSDQSRNIDADELDFDRWRAPVAARLRELLNEDLGPGTNHSRLRRRLLDLAAALAGTIDDVKDNQFRLGYAIEALGLLVGVYRDAADDMPALNAAVFVDVDHLQIQLMLGRSKLVAWTRFQQAADADELEEGGADPAAVSASLGAAETALLESRFHNIIDPELPRSFRWIRAAIADPATTTRRMVYGAVKSLENVGSFLGQLALRTAKETIEGTAQQIGKKAAAALLLALSGALLHLSGALPVAWPWLKPLLEAAAKVLGG